MGSIINWLSGKKTIGAAIATGVIGALTQQGVISTQTGTLIMTILGTLTAIFMRLAIGKANGTNTDAAK